MCFLFHKTINLFIYPFIHNSSLIYSFIHSARNQNTSEQMKQVQFVSPFTENCKKTEAVISFRTVRLQSETTTILRKYLEQYHWLASLIRINSTRELPYVWSNG